METLLILVILFIVLDIVSLRWGYDSAEKIDSPEWERRVTWRWRQRHIQARNALGEREVQ